MKIVFFTGAGISAAAGIPTYRDNGTSWRDPDLEAKSHSSRYGNHLDELWDKHWGPVSQKMGEGKPTEAHDAIAALEEDHEVIVVTQNIDNLHERAGSSNVIHLHGTMTIKCMKCHVPTLTSGWQGSGAPKCYNCLKHKTRPDVVLFGEQLNKKQFRSVYAELLDADHLVVVGSSLNVQPAAGIVMDCLSSKNIHTTLINKDKANFWAFFDDVIWGNADDGMEKFVGNLSQD